MAFPDRPIAFVLASTNHGTMIVNRNDQRMVGPDQGIGVGFQLLNKSSFDPSEIGMVCLLLDCRRAHFGPGVVAIDGGANLGVHAVEWARHMHGWGSVLAFEAQEVVYYALAGNVALNNCFNARARLAALGAAPGEMLVPRPDYLRPGSFGSLELKQRSSTEFIGQSVSYEAQDCQPVPVVSLDSLGLQRVDLVKLDVEGMEAEVLQGAASMLREQRPIFLVELIKSDPRQLQAIFDSAGYRCHRVGINLLAVHESDPTLANIQVGPGSGGQVQGRPKQD